MDTFSIKKQHRSYTMYKQELRD